MGRAPCCDKSKVKKGPWSPEEDATLKNYIHNHGVGGSWIALPTKAGLKRCGKSCRLRWLNYLRPDIKHGGFTHEEDNIIYTLYSKLGSRWSVIASHLAGRTDNDVKNYWNTKLKKKLVAAVSETNFNETNLKIPTTTNLDFQNPTPSMPILVPETESKFPPNSNVLSLLNQISPSLVTSYALNSYTHNLNHATSSSQEGNICGFSSDTVENNMCYGINTGIGDLGFSENFGMEFSHGLNSGIGEFGNYYPNLGNSFYQSVTNQY